MRVPLVLALAVLAAGCIGEDAEPQSQPQADAQTDAMSSRTLEEDFGGTALGTPAQPQVHEFKFAVPQGAVGVNATLAWGTPAARFDLALVLVVLLAGCVGEEPASQEAPQDDVRTDDMSSRTLEADFSGTALGTPAQPQVHEFPFSVPTGAVGVNATLAWDSPAARFELALVDPDGEVAAEGYPETEGRLVAATLDPPRSGEWTMRVTATLAVNVPFTLHAVAELIVPDDNLVRQTATLRTPGFNEVNVIMEANATFTFAYNATGDVKWDVHSHPPEGVKYWDQGTSASHAGSFTAPERGIYSLLFQNQGAVPVEITFEMRGRFRLHSHAQ